MERTFVKGPRQSPLQVSETLLVAVENLGFSQLRLFCEVKNFGYPSTIYLDSQIFGGPGSHEDVSAHQSLSRERL